MAGLSSSTRVGFIISDLKESWYFRIWALTWAVCAIISFVTLILLAVAVTAATKHPIQRVYFHNSKKLTFPKFQLHSFSAEFMVPPNCTHLGKSVPVSPCNNNYALVNHCVQIDGSKATATNTKKATANLDDQRIDCTALVNATTYNGTAAFPMVTWALASQSETDYSAPFALMFIEPGTWAWVLVNRVVEDGDTYWDRSLVYHGYYNNALQNGQELVYEISTIINSFNNLEITPRVSFDGWNVVGFTGGFGFFTYILQTVFMFLVGFILDKNSKFLANGSHSHETSSHSAVPSSSEGYQRM